jgi:hypothetical protein
MGCSFFSKKKLVEELKISKGKLAVEKSNRKGSPTGTKRNDQKRPPHPPELKPLSSHGDDDDRGSIGPEMQTGATTPVGDAVEAAAAGSSSLIFLGTGCSGALPHMRCLIQPSTPPCAVCSQALTLPPERNPNYRCALTSFQAGVRPRILRTLSANAHSNFREPNHLYSIFETYIPFRFAVFVLQIGPDGDCLVISYDW